MYASKQQATSNKQQATSNKQQAKRGIRNFGFGSLASFGIISTAMTFPAIAADLPNGSIYSITGSQATGGSAQSFSTSYTATTTGSNYLLFAFREDPAFWFFGNVSMTANGGSTNLLLNPTFESGGPVTVNGYSTQAPTNWGVVYQDGTQPAAAGSWRQEPLSGLNSGGTWVDGAVGSFDGIYQGVSLTTGTSYNISFDAYNPNGTVGPNGNPSTNSYAQLGVFAGTCADIALPIASCSVAGSGFTSLALPSETSNAGTPTPTPTPCVRIVVASNF
jgi:fibronectin-binding autotransporter adhesin